jgi:hypothetical protein
MRAKIIDWVFEVIQAYKASSRTFHLCVRIIDLYSCEVKNLLPIDLYKIAVTSLFMAFKYEEVSCISVETLSLKVTQSLMSKQDIINFEKKIFAALRFSLFIPTVIDFYESLGGELDDNSNAYAHFLCDISIMSIELAGKAQAKLAEAIKIIVAKKEKPTQGPLALCIQEINCLVEAFDPENFPSFMDKYAKFLIK